MGLAVHLDGVWESYRTRRRRSRRGREWALAGVDLEIPAGELFGVVGPNGAGKTTLLQVVAGVLRPTRGTCTTSGRVSSLVELGAGISRDLSGRENLLVGGVLLGMSRREVRRKYDEIVAFTGLDDATLDEPIRTYSAGMSLRLAFSVVLHSDPAVLLVDEVLAVGDEAFQARGLARIDELRAGGTAVVLVSHDLDLVERHCDRVGILTDGRFAHVGATAETVARYRELAAASTGAVDGRR